MSEIQDGGPAFPEAGMTGLPNGDFLYGRSGMSLRDWFAGQALAGLSAGLCANAATQPGDPCFDRAKGRFYFTEAATDAYSIADAMLAARKDAS